MTKESRSRSITKAAFIINGQQVVLDEIFDVRLEMLLKLKTRSPDEEYEQFSLICVLDTHNKIEKFTSREEALKVYEELKIALNMGD